MSSGNEPAQDETKTGRAAHLGTMFDTAGRHAVVFSLLSYGVGFVVAVGYYAQIGVPAHELSHDTILAAGLACWLVFGASWVFGLHIRLTVIVRCTNKQWPTAAAEGALALLVGYCLFIGMFGLPWVALPFVVLISLFGVTSGPRVPMAEASSVLAEPWAATRVVLLLVVAFAMFILMIFPRMPPQLGGARPILVHTTQVDLSHPDVAKDEPWARAQCEQSPYRTAPYRLACRRAYLGYQSQTHAYLIVEEEPGWCWTRRPDPGPSVPSEATCFVRLPAAELSRVELPSKR